MGNDTDGHSAWQLLRHLRERAGGTAQSSRRMLGAAAVVGGPLRYPCLAGLRLRHVAPSVLVWFAATAGEVVALVVLAALRAWFELGLDAHAA